MSFLKASMAAVVALSMTSAPAIAAADSASRLSLAASHSSDRAGADVEDANQLGGGFLIPVLALAAILAGIWVVVDDSDEEPASP